MPPLEERVRQLEGTLNLLIKSNKYTFQRDIQIFDGRNMQLARGTGTKIGTATDQLLGFYNTTPVNQPDTIDTINFTTVSGSGADATINTNFDNAEDRLNSFRSRLRELGLIA